MNKGSVVRKYIVCVWIIVAILLKDKSRRKKIIIIIITTTTYIISVLFRVHYDIVPLFGAIFVFTEQQVCGQRIYPSYNAIEITTLLIVR